MTDPTGDGLWFCPDCETEGPGEAPEECPKCGTWAIYQLLDPGTPEDRHAAEKAAGQLEMLA